RRGHGRAAPGWASPSPGSSWSSTAAASMCRAAPATAASFACCCLWKARRRPLLQLLQPFHRPGKDPFFLGEAEHLHRFVGRHPFVTQRLPGKLNLPTLPFGEEIVHFLLNEAEVRTRSPCKVVALLFLEA